MKLNSMTLVAVLGATCLLSALPTVAGNAPDVVWEVPTPSGLGNAIQGVGWSPASSGRVAVGSTDRWVRTRQANGGALFYSILQPPHSGSANQTIFSLDGVYLAVHNSSGGLGYRIYRAADAFFLGKLTVTIDANSIVHFAPDAQLSASVGASGTVSRWRFADFTVVQTLGSGYQHTTTVFNFSPNGAYQSAAIQGKITIRRTSGGATVRVISGGSTQGFTPAAFTPDSSGIAAWASGTNETTLWRISDGAVLMHFADGVPEEGIGSIRFTPDGARLVTTGYLPFVDSQGLWQQKGVIRFWRVADGALRTMYDARTGIGVTSTIAWSRDASQFVYGTQEGTAVVARTPSP